MSIDVLRCYHNYRTVLQEGLESTFHVVIHFRFISDTGTVNLVTNKSIKCPKTLTLLVIYLVPDHSFKNI